MTNFSLQGFTRLDKLGKEKIDRLIIRLYVNVGKQVDHPFRRTYRRCSSGRIHLSACPRLHTEQLSDKLSFLHPSSSTRIIRL